MSGSKAPDFDAYGLFRAAHSHVSAPLRPVLDMCHWHMSSTLASYYFDAVSLQKVSPADRVILPGCFGYTKNPGLLTRDPLKRDV